jgi:hypothetical protein
MKKFKYMVIASFVTLGILTTSSCKKFYDINTDPDAVADAPIDQQLSSLTVNVGFFAGSDMNRFSSILAQQFSGQSTGAQNQTQDYEKYLIQGTDANNAWSTMYATILNDAENIIVKANETNSPHYSGVAKILKAYAYQTTVDFYGDVPFSETQKLTGNTQPKYDSAADIYTALITLLNEGITEVTAATSARSPGLNSTIYPGTFTTTQANWVKFANTLKLRLYIHYSEKDPAFAKAQIDQLVNSGVPFFASNADNFQMYFVNVAAGQNPIDQYQKARVGYLVANNNLVSIMNAKADPRRASYFTEYPAGSGQYLGSVGGASPSQNYSKFNTYLRGALSAGVYAGDAPIRMLTFAEYNFIRAEAALRFASPGSAQAFFTAGITASMSDAGVSATAIATYLATNGVLAGTPAQQLQQIITEKYVASFGVLVEAWTDWRRTGYPAIAPPANAVVPFVPRSLYYPQSEIDLNPNAKQKTGLDVRIFWDTRQ